MTITAVDGTGEVVTITNLTVEVTTTVATIMTDPAGITTDTMTTTMVIVAS